MASSITKQLRPSVEKQKTVRIPLKQPEEALDKSDVAELSLLQISRMTCDELIRVIRAAQLPLLRPDVDEQLEFQDRPTLERLVYLARRCCRNQGC